MKFKSKLLLTLFLGMVISVASAQISLAGPSISGDSQVYPGRTYTYTVTITENASYISGTAATNGILGSQIKDWSKVSESASNENITATTTITVSIPSSAAIGSTGTIIVDGQGTKVDSDTKLSTMFNISASKTITVIALPTPPPTRWDLAVNDIRNVEDGGNITIEMNPEDNKEINIPIEVFEAIKESKIILTIDYGSFKITIDGNLVGEIPSDITKVNVGITMKEEQRDSDMLVFALNNTSELFYIAEYALQPNTGTYEDMIYVYRSYPIINLLEYVNAASLDSEGYVIAKVFASGIYVISSANIAGSEGNIDMETFIELSATPTPKPTAVPTVTPVPTFTPNPPSQPKEEDDVVLPLTVWILAGIIAIIIIAFVTALAVGIKRQNKRQIE